MPLRPLAAFLLGIFLSAGPALAETRLLMLDEAGCPWCAAWDEEVGDAYHKTEEGRRAPLLRTSIHEPLPEGVVLERRAHYTPTFVLLDDGREVGRIEGYPGEDFFYSRLDGLLGRLDRKKD